MKRAPSAVTIRIAVIAALSVAASFFILPSAPAAAQDAVAQDAAVQGEASTRQIEYANGLYSRGWYDDAVVEYEKFLKDYPQDPRAQDARYFLAESLYQMKQWDKALEAFEKEIAASPDSDWRTNSLFRKAMLLYRANEKAGSIKILQALMNRPDITPDVKQTAYLTLGRAYTDTGQPEKARETFQKSLAEFPDGDLAPNVNFEMARVALSEKNYDEALKAFRAVAAKPDSEFAPEAAYRVAEILHAQKKFPEAAKAYKVARDGFPGSPWRTEAGYNVAWCSWYAGDKVAAVSATTDLLKELKGNEYRPGALYLRGLAEYDLGRYDAALADFDTAAAVPDEGLGDEQKDYREKASVRALWALYSSGRDEDLLSRTQVWLSEKRAQDADGEVRFLSGESHYRSGDLQNALLDFLDLLTNFPESRFRKSAIARIGWCQFKLKQFPKAAQFFDRFAELYPDDELTPGSIRSAGDSYYAAEDYDKAAARYRTFVDKYPKAAGAEEALYRLGICYYKQKKYDQQAEAYRELLENYPDSDYAGNASYWIGFNLYRKKQYDGAISAFEQVTTRHPDSPFADEARVQRAACLFLVNNATAAAQAYHDIAVAHPSIQLATQTLLWTGEELDRQKRYDDSAETFRILMDRYPYEDIIEISLYRIGQAMLDKQDWAKALPAFQRLLANYGEGPFGDDAAYGLGRAYMGLQRYQDAIEPLVRVTQGRHELSAQANLLLGDAYRELKRYADANRAYAEVALVHDDPRYVPKAIYYAGDTAEKLGKTDRALELYHELDERFPLSPYNGKAKERILALTGGTPDGNTPANNTPSGSNSEGGE